VFERIWALERVKEHRYESPVFQSANYIHAVEYAIFVERKLEKTKKRNHDMLFGTANGSIELVGGESNPDRLVYQSYPTTL
jgi:hypothetical protein